MNQFVLGIDVGGTNIKLGLVHPQGRIIHRDHLVTDQYSRSKQKLIEALQKACLNLIDKASLKRKDVCGIGIGLPGLIDSEQGVVKFLPNIPGWKNVPLRKMFEQTLGLPTLLENDANLIALAEWRLGAGRGVKNLICVTLGTGTGGGLILNNQLYRGEGFVAGEIGHVPLNEKGPRCNCGGIACLERYVGNRMLLSLSRRIFHNQQISLPETFRLASQGDARAIKFWEQMAVHLGNGLIGAVNLLNPRLIIFGGGVSNNFKFFAKTVKKVIDQRAMKVQSAMVKIARAQLGDDAGIIGALVLVQPDRLGR